MKLSMPRGLFRKYLIFLVMLVGGVLSVSSAIDLYFSYQETKQSIVRLERTKALAAASEIERYLGQIVQHLRGTMQGAIDVSALGTAGIGIQAGGHSRAAALAEQREIDFLRLLRNVPAITEVRHLDLAGKEQLRTSRLALDAVASGQDYADTPRIRRGEIEKDLYQPGLLQERDRAVHHDGRGAGRDRRRGDGGRGQRQGDLGRGDAHRHGARGQCVRRGFERPAHRPSRSAARAGEARSLQCAAGQGGPGAARRRRAGRAGVHDCRGPAGRPGARRSCGDSGARLARVHRAPGRGYLRTAARRDGAQRRGVGVGPSAGNLGERRAGPQDGRADPPAAGRRGARRRG